MLQVEMSASIRKETGKGAMRQLRLKGMTPAVVYGGGEDALSLELETQPFFQKLLGIYRRNAVVTLKLDDGSTKHVLVKDVQTDPIKDTLVHADFLEIDLQKARIFNVPVDVTGNAKGADLGGVLALTNETIAVKAAPLDVPDSFEVDVTNLNIGDSIKINEIDIPGNLELIADPEAVCVGVVAPKKGGAEADDEEALEEGEGEEAPAAE